jgi:pyruvate dehydrogenase E2 component (dihydrolipoamide acetyltransferase)
MAYVDVVLPKIGMAMQEGVITAWKKQEGEHVAKGEELFEMETEKVSVAVESPDSGILDEIFVGEGEEVPVDTVVARLRQE